MRPSYNLNECSFLRLRKLARRVTQIYDHALAPSGLSTSQFSMLAHIWFFKNPTVSQLGEQLVMDPSTVTRNLRPLADKGWITLAVSEADRRQREARLTEAGLEMLRGAVPHWMTAQERVNAQLGGEEATALHSAVDHALGRLHL